MRLVTFAIGLFYLISSTIGIKRFGIHGGHEAKPHSHPYEVVFMDTIGDVWGGGAIVNEDSIFTSGELCYWLALTDVIVAGDHDISKDEGTEQWREVKELIYHPKFDPDSYIHPPWDACIVKLNETLTFNEYVSNVNLPELDQEFTGSAILAGWDNYENDTYVDTLSEIELMLVDSDICSEEYAEVGLVYFDPDNMICAGADMSTGPDEFDIGAPLMCGDILCGVASAQLEGLIWNHPAIFTKASKMVDFIMENI